MSKLREALQYIRESKPSQAEDILFEHASGVVAQKLVEMKKMIQARLYPTIFEGVVDVKSNGSHLSDIHSYDDHIGHIEKTKASAGHDLYRVVSYTHAQPPSEYHKSHAAAKASAHTLIQRHVDSEHHAMSEEITEGHDIPGVAKWHMYAGGTSAAEGKHGYSLHPEHGNYKINPISSKNGKHVGYHLGYENIKGRLGGGLHHDLGMHSSPAKAAKAARTHHEAVGELKEEDLNEAAYLKRAVYHFHASDEHHKIAIKRDENGDGPHRQAALAHQAAGKSYFNAADVEPIWPHGNAKEHHRLTNIAHEHSRNAIAQSIKLKRDLKEEPIEESEMHGDYKVTRPEMAGQTVYHEPSKSMVGATETIDHKHPQYSHTNQVMAHHAHGPTYHSTHERAVQHIIAKHKELGESTEVKNHTHGSSVHKDGKHVGNVSFVSHDGRQVYYSTAGHDSDRSKWDEINKSHATHDDAVSHIKKCQNITEEVVVESHKNNNVQKQGRTKLVKVRVRGGKVQRRKKLSNVPGYRVHDGKAVRMSSAERRHRKMGARKAKIKRRSKKSQIHRKLLKSLRVRKSRGL